LQAALPPTLAGRVVRCPGDDANVARADIVVTTTPAGTPLFRAEALRDDAHVVAIGSATPVMHEVPAAAFLRSQVWVDTPQALHEAGDCLRAVEAGWRADALAGDLFDLLGGAPPRAAPRTLFKSVGHAAQDLAILIALWRRLSGEA
ncbi:MAG: ornithine cyclodeaminase family protein, partial [Candidatus Lambdaproteobacteria bacterium]|nr:ornithine cyclodeaminase family protein [Candidatus Lambdaproteobacteria bacterium]